MPQGRGGGWLFRAAWRWGVLGEGGDEQRRGGFSLSGLSQRGGHGTVSLQKLQHGERRWVLPSGQGRQGLGVLGSAGVWRGLSCSPPCCCASAGPQHAASSSRISPVPAHGSQVPGSPWGADLWLRTPVSPGNGPGGPSPPGENGLAPSPAACCEAGRAPAGARAGGSCEPAARAPAPAFPRSRLGARSPHPWFAAACPRLPAALPRFRL